ncbi:MAG: cardiolipin synthase [Moraxellaceae bacterium]|nr:MAG: cardiolipin synthase [Moraxellaceae bacterium]
MELLIDFIIVAVYVLASIAAIHAVLHTRTAQGSIAWLVSLITLPFLSLPLYLIFGPRKIQGYIKARRAGDLEINHLARILLERSNAFKSTLKIHQESIKVTEDLAKLPFTHHNEVNLLIDGPQSFNRFFEAIEAAEHYVLVQFYIVRDDATGQKFKDALLKKVRQGVKVYLLYDSIGSYELSSDYINALKLGGIEVHGFNDTSLRNNRYLINFRNHRKILVVDGKTAFVGGLNIGNEYMGQDPKFTTWRDTHAEFSGPCVQSVQMVFIEDWYWVTQDLPQLNWHPTAAEGIKRNPLRDDTLDNAQDDTSNHSLSSDSDNSLDSAAKSDNERPSSVANKDVLVLATGPADTLESGTLFFLQLVNSAKSRLWIATPYFVPDIQLISALQLAALRGVDVRILLPKKSDNLLMHLTSYATMNETAKAGIKFYHYLPGFMHQKVLLIDKDITAIGTANFGNRSFRLNFELTMLIAGKNIAKDVETMLRSDFAQSKLLNAADYEVLPFLSKLLIQLARLSSPVQ